MASVAPWCRCCCQSLPNLFKRLVNYLLTSFPSQQKQSKKTRRIHTPRAHMWILPGPFCFRQRPWLATQSCTLGRMQWRYLNHPLCPSAPAALAPSLPLVVSRELRVPLGFSSSLLLPVHSLQSKREGYATLAFTQKQARILGATETSTHPHGHLPRQPTFG